MNDTGVAYFVWRRPEETQRTLTALLRNDFKYVYIFQDGMSSSHNQDGWLAVNSIVKDAAENDCRVELSVSKQNKGLA